MWRRLLLAERGPLLRYGVAVALAAASLLLVHALQEAEEGRYSSLALGSVVVSAIYGGLGPALLDTAITAIGIDYLFSRSRSLPFESWMHLIHIGVHGLLGALIASIVASLHNAYREADAARRTREDLLALVSHDLRSPLASILLNAELLKRSGAPQLQAAARGVERSARQMRRLIEDLLDAVRIEKGHFRIEPELHRLGDIVEDALLGVQAAAEAKGLRITLAMDNAASGALRCDRVRLTQALANLVANAVKFSPEAGLIEIEVRATAAERAIAVKDGGAGIAEADLPHIFGRYWQAAATAHRGTGLGLFIAKSIAEAHGGRIEVDSRPGQGSTFVLRLPAK